MVVAVLAMTYWTVDASERAIADLLEAQDGILHAGDRSHHSTPLGRNSSPKCLDEGLPVRTWRLRGRHAKIRARLCHGSSAGSCVKRAGTSSKLSFDKGLPARAYHAYQHILHAGVWSKAFVELSNSYPVPVTVRLCVDY